MARQEDCIAFQLAQALSSRYAVDWVLDAESGRTTEDMADHLESMAPQHFDLALTSLGVNDVKSGLSVAAFMGHQKRLISLLREKFHVRRMMVTAVPPMEKFLALPWPLSGYLGHRAAAMNRAISRWLANEDDCTFLRIELPFEDGLMAEDGFHPGPRLHRIWAQQAAAEVTKCFAGTGEPR